jgi:hypothetical protein
MEGLTVGRHRNMDILKGIQADLPSPNRPPVPPLPLGLDVLLRKLLLFLQDPTELGKLC